MRRPRPRTVLLLALLTAVSALAAPGAARAAIPSAPLVDFRGEVVPASHYRGKVCVFFVCGRHSNKQMDRLTRRFGARVGDDPRVGYLTVIDVRQVPRLFRPLVHRVLGRVHRDTVVRIQRFQRDLGRPPDPDLGRRFYLVTDWDGRIQRELGTDHRDVDVEMAVVAPDGRRLGVFRGEAGVSRMIEAVERELGRH